MTEQALGHVYLVDDNPDIRFYLSDLLRKMGYTVEEYGSAPNFLSESMDISPAVLVLDMRMPGMNGVELQNKLIQLGRHTPIIFISGESQSQEIIGAMKNGAIDFLWKPFQIQTLIDAIDRGLVLDRKKRESFVRLHDVRRRYAQLSAREREVFVLMMQGHTNKGISQMMAILPDTAKKHRANVLLKMQVSQLSELMSLCKGLALDLL